jgi:uncharacterized membrane protein
MKRRTFRSLDYHYVAVNLERKKKMKKDSFVASLVWGRIGAALLCMAAFILTMFGIDFSAEEQANLNELVTGILAGIAGVLAIISKLREKKE